MQALCLCRHCDACVPFEAFTWAKNALVEGQKASGKKFFFVEMNIEKNAGFYDVQCSTVSKLEK